MNRKIQSTAPSYFSHRFTLFAGLAAVSAVPSTLLCQAIMPGPHETPASLVGRVTNEAGTPLGADIMVYGRAIIDGRVDLFAMCSTATDTEGGYACKALRPGRYIVSATIKPVASQAGSKPPTFVYQRTFSPADTSLAEASIVQLQPGATGVADVTMRSCPPGQLNGHLPDRPLSPSFLVRERYGSFEFPVDGQMAYDAKTGDFHVTGLPTGEFRVNADWSASGRPQESSGLATLAPGQSSPIVLAALVRHKLSGTLHYSDEQQQTQVAFPSSIELLGLGSKAGWQLSVPVAVDGSFAFPEIAGGDYALQVSLVSGVYVEQVAGRGTNVLHVDANTTSEGMSITLATTVASVEGKVNSGDVIRNKTGVVLENLKVENVILVYPDQNGHFAIDHLPPGNYRVFAWTDLTQTEYRNVTELAKRKKDSVVIDLDNDSHLTNVELPLIPSGT